MNKVFFIRQYDYTPELLRHALQQILMPVAAKYGGFHNKKIMIKPNLLEYRKPEDPACVHPAMLNVLCELLRDEGAAKISIIENPAVHTAPAIISAMGIGEKLQDLQIHIANCERYEKIPTHKNAIFQQLEIATEFRDHDLIIDFAKAKTHAMMTLTLAVKNLFGLIRGSERLGWHLAVGKDYHKFADLLLDIYTLVKPHISLLDAVTGMEGNGPGSGDPVQLGFIAAADDALALDMSVAGILGCPDIPILSRAAERNMLPQYENCGDIPAPLNIKLPEPPLPTLAWGVYFPVKLRDYLRKKMVSYPVVDKNTCIGCGLCVQKCPPQSLKLKKGKPRFHYPECIRCYCCQEYCPKGAITSGKTFLMRCADIFERLFRIGKRH